MKEEREKMKAIQFYPSKKICGVLCFLGMALLIVLFHALPAVAKEKVDQVVVKKKAREMLLMSEGTVVRSYTVSLGGNPVGHKVKQGDARTPEGRYVIDYRNPYSNYHLSLHISYPDARDRQRAKSLGVDPGGMIMIHGAPNGWRWPGNLLKLSDWTNGCIAVSNTEIEEIWEFVKDGTPIEIHP